jgi:hypothetical protein
MAEVWFATKAGATWRRSLMPALASEDESSFGCAFGWDERVAEPPRAGVGRVSSEGAVTAGRAAAALELRSGVCSTCLVARPRRR